MTALPLEPHTEAEEARLARFEAAEPAEESAVERVARALCDGDAEDHDTYTWDEANDELRDEYRRAACHAIGAMKGGSRAEEALARVEALAATWDRIADVWQENADHPNARPEHRATYLAERTDFRDRARLLRAATAAPVAVAGQHTTDEERA